MQGLCEYISGLGYLGRGIFIGRRGGVSVLCYFISGRSENSKNRVFVCEGKDVRILPFDPAVMQDPSLVIYSPVRCFESQMILSNGDQSDTLFESFEAGESFEVALRKRCFEPDAPHFTPRISGVLDLETWQYKLSILKSGDEAGTTCNRFFYEYESLEGCGHFLHTYLGDAPRLPCFEGEPKKLSLPKDLDGFPLAFWESLNADYKVSACVKFFGDRQETHLFNIHKEGE